MIEITVKLKIKGQEIELTQQEAQKLYEALGNLVIAPKLITNVPVFRDYQLPKPTFDWPNYPVADGGQANE